MSAALYRRYRPETFQQVVGQEHVTAPLMAALRNNRTNHAYLFSGPRGCGKTTSARILARCLNCAEGPTDTPCGKCPSCRELSRDGSGSLDVVEMDAASHGGVDDARDLRERANFAPVRDRYKIFIIDEAHMVSNQGFNALLKLVEEPPAHIKFIFATTEPEKVLGTIRSRTHHYPFRLVAPDILENYLLQVCKQEQVAVDEGVLSLVIRAGGGSVRDTLSVLDQLMGGQEGGRIEYEMAQNLLGFTDQALLVQMVAALEQADGAAIFQVLDKVAHSGHDPRRFTEDLLERFRDLVIMAVTGDESRKVIAGMPQTQYEQMRTEAAGLGVAKATRVASLLNESLNTMAGAVSPRMQLELLFARILVQMQQGAGAASMPASTGGDLAPATTGAAAGRSGGAVSAAAARSSLAAARAHADVSTDKPAAQPADTSRQSAPALDAQPERAQTPALDAGRAPARLTAPVPETGAVAANESQQPAQSAAPADPVTAALASWGEPENVAHSEPSSASQAASKSRSQAAPEAASHPGSKAEPAHLEPRAQTRQTPPPMPSAAAASKNSAGAAENTDFTEDSTALTLTDIKQRWAQVLELITKRRKATNIFLDCAKAGLVDLRGRELYLVLNNDDLVKSFASHRPIVEAALSEVFSEQIGVVAVTREQFSHSKSHRPAENGAPLETSQELLSEARASWSDLDASPSSSAPNSAAPNNLARSNDASVTGQAQSPASFKSAPTAEPHTASHPEPVLDPLPDSAADSGLDSARGHKVTAADFEAEYADVPWPEVAQAENMPENSTLASPLTTTSPTSTASTTPAPAASNTQETVQTGGTKNTTAGSSLAASRAPVAVGSARPPKSADIEVVSSANSADSTENISKLEEKWADIPDPMHDENAERSGKIGYPLLKEVFNAVLLEEN